MRPLQNTKVLEVSGLMMWLLLVHPLQKDYYLRETGRSLISLGYFDLKFIFGHKGTPGLNEVRFFGHLLYQS